MPGRQLGRGYELGVPVRGLVTAYLPFWPNGVLESAK